jgi:hypothetical protein
MTRVSIAGWELVAFWLVVSAPAGMIFSYSPGTAPVTAITIVQDMLAPSEPFDNWMVCEPLTADKVPPQLLTGAGAGDPATATPAGRTPGSVSIKPIPLKGTLLVFWIVMVSNENSPAAIGLGSKNLLTCWRLPGWSTWLPPGPDCLPRWRWSPRLRGSYL